MRQGRDGDEQRAVPGPPPAREHEPDGEVDVQVQESHAVADPVERTAEARRGAAQPRQLAIGRVEHIRQDEEQQADHVHTGIAIGEQVAGDEPDQNAPEGDLVGRDARRLQGPGDADAEGTEEPEVDPLLDGGALMREVVRRLH